MDNNQNHPERGAHLRLVAEMAKGSEPTRTAASTADPPRTPTRNSTRKATKTNAADSPSSPSHQATSPRDLRSPANSVRRSSQQSLLARQRHFRQMATQQSSESGSSKFPPSSPQPLHSSYQVNTVPQRPFGFFARTSQQQPVDGAYLMPPMAQQSPFEIFPPSTTQQQTVDQASPTPQRITLGFQGMPMSHPPQVPHGPSSTMSREYPQSFLSQPDPPQTFRGTSDPWRIGQETQQAPILDAPLEYSPTGLPGTVGPSMLAVDRGSALSPRPGQKRHFSSPTAEFMEFGGAKVFVQNNDFPEGVVLEVFKPAFMKDLYMPRLRPCHPKPELTAEALKLVDHKIFVERYACNQKCRNKGVCVHFPIRPWSSTYSRRTHLHHMR